MKAWRGIATHYELFQLELLKKGSPPADLHTRGKTVTRSVGKLKELYDKTPESYLAGLHLCASMIWIKDLMRTTP